MTSKERHEIRYQRRKAKRLQKKKENEDKLGSYDDIFTFINLYESFYSCEKGVRWKCSIQRYESILPLNSISLYRMMKNRKFKTMGFLEFYISERGKRRHIRALKIKERCIQKVLCDKYLIPLLSKQLIYDNGASLKGKGPDFSLRRLRCHLQRHFKKYGNEGYIFQYDFSSFFDSIDHNILLKNLKKLIHDKDIYNVIYKSVKSFGDVGLGLGSQVSQICAIFYPTLLDKYFKEVLHIKGYGRYMDDGYAICRTKEEVNKCKEGLEKMCKLLNLKINKKKMKVTKLSRTFTFLKKRIFMTDSGKIVMRLGKESIVRARRKVKKLFKMLSNPNGKKIKLHDIKCSCNSWIGLANRFKNYYTVLNYKELVNRLYNNYLNSIHNYTTHKRRMYSYKSTSFNFY